MLGPKTCKYCDYIYIVQVGRGMPPIATLKLKLKLVQGNTRNISKGLTYPIWYDVCSKYMYGVKVHIYLSTKNHG